MCALGHSGVHGELALETDDLLKEMDRFGIQRALVSHFAGEEYDVEEGNNLLARECHERLVPAWAALPDQLLQKLGAATPRPCAFLSESRNIISPRRHGVRGSFTNTSKNIPS